MKNPIKINVFIFLGIIGSFFLGEMVLRFTPVLNEKYGIMQFEGYRGKELYEFDENHRPSRHVGYEPVPESAEHINSLGMFDKEYEYRKKKSTLRIVFLGDSITAHSGYTNMLENQLNYFIDRNTAPGEKTINSIEVWNCAVGGYQIDQYVKYLKHKALKFKPDFVVVTFCLNDLMEGIPVLYKTEEGLEEYYIPKFSNNFLFSKKMFKLSFLYRFFYLHITKRLNIKNDPKQIADKYLSELKSITDRKKIGFSAVVFPFIKPLELYTDTEKRDYEILINSLKKLEIEYFDLTDLFGNYYKKADYMDFRAKEEDQIHFSEIGENIIVGSLLDYLLKALPRHFSSK